MRVLLIALLFISLPFLTPPAYVLSDDKIDTITIRLKHRLAKDITPYLEPHLSETGKISTQGNDITIRSNKLNINELLVIIGDLDRTDYIQLVISITMNVKAIHNINTRSIQVGTNSWTKINYGITYSNRVRETLENGNLVEKINYVRVIESFQVFSNIDSNNKSLTLKIRPAQESSISNEQLTVTKLNIDELLDDDLQITLNGKINEWISLGSAINSLYVSDEEDAKTIYERQKLTSNMAIKIQLLQ